MYDFCELFTDLEFQQQWVFFWKGEKGISDTQLALNAKDDDLVTQVSRSTNFSYEDKFQGQRTQRLQRSFITTSTLCALSVPWKIWERKKTNLLTAEKHYKSHTDVIS